MVLKFVYIQNMKMASLKDGARDGIFSIVLQVLLEFAKTESERQKQGQKVENCKG